jgi:hypothetical protein
MIGLVFLKRSRPRELVARFCTIGLRAATELVCHVYLASIRSRGP